MSYSLHAEPAAAASSPLPSQARRSERQRQAPITLQSEQENIYLEQAEAADVEAALLLSLQEPDEAAPDEVQIEAALSEDEESAEEEEEKEEMKDAHPHDWHAPAAERLRAPFPLPLRVAVGQPRRIIGAGRATRLQLLRLFLTPDLVNSWAELTNAAAHVDWAETDAEELLAFIGVHISMGIDSLPQRRMYWADQTRHSIIANLLSRERFESLNRYLTVSEPEVAAAPRNPFSSVRSFVASLNHSFSHHWNPGRHLALDESMVSFRGRSDIKQFVPGKPHPHGYKIWVLANENYVLQFQLYEGKAAAGPSIHDMVMQLTQLYRNSAHVLFIDSLFTSPTLAHSLFNVGIRVCGSVKRNRIGMPSTGQLPLAATHALGAGEALQMQQGEERVLTLCTWKDKRLILLLYNHIDPRLTTSLQRWSETGEIYQLPCPQAISDYFHYARAVDIINQLHYSYSPGRKSRRCSTRLVWWLIDICILNAYRLWQCDHPEESHLSFRMALMHQLMEQLPPERRPQRQHSGMGAGAAPHLTHFSDLSDVPGDCAHCSAGRQQRKRTRYICSACKVHLCIGACFSQYHTNV